ncbi:DNA primase [Sandaracinobacter neustonicus]|uniref:DNA primase n=1 Tax=Sandaracinobacter neustonicus TaxID=1715348 RepID=A0A501XEJ7_9SPHN|nr:DNA primase [Sandaracinobacter neustonicus]TPE58723.1 DNA primase [Sandaracinobacter neustonicus]
MSLPPDFLDDLRARTGLAAVVGRRVKLTRAGREMKGCCPFHNEKSPSFYVNEDKGFYHCFGCGAHGDAIRFVMEQDGLTFMDAVKALAAEAGLTVPEMRPESPETKKRAGLTELIAATEDWYRLQMATPAGAAAGAYLGRRQVAPALQTLFGIGFAPDSKEALTKHLKAAFPDMEPEQMLEAGLAGESEGRRYDRFRGRLMFPIHDARGRPVGFGGRILGDGEPKYLNSPEGPVFHKGKLLYNYHRAAPAARKSGRLLVVEGYMDVVGLAGAGLMEAVAPLGTALTEDQMQLAWKLVPEPMLAFDGDGAGMRAASRAATRALPLIGPGRSLRFVALPKGQDPDDLARSGGAAAVEALLGTAVPLERFLFEREADAAPLDTPERRAEFRQRLKALANEIADPDVKRDYLRTWLDRADALLRPARPERAAFRPDPGRRRGFQGPPPLQPARPETRAAAAAQQEQTCAMLLKTLSQNPALVDELVEALAELPLETPSYMLARDRLIAHQPPGELLAGHAPLFGNLDSAELLRGRVAAALASVTESHHIRQAADEPRNLDSDEAFADALLRQEQRRAQRQQAFSRLRKLAIENGGA